MTPARRAAAALRARPDLAERVLLLAEPALVAKVASPEDVVALVLPHLAGRETEALVAIALDRRRRVVDVAVLTTGTAAFTIVDSAQVYRWALTRTRAVCAVILAHNHPSNDPTPSVQDVDVTRRVAAAGRVVGVQLLDHVVVCDNGTFESIADRGELPAYTDAVGVLADRSAR